MGVIGVDLKLDLNKVLEAAKKEELKRLNIAALRVQRVARKLVNRKNPGGLKARKGSIAPAPPYKRTGTLRKAILKKVYTNLIEARIGILHRGLGYYGNMLEFGAERSMGWLEPRPFMRPAYEQSTTDYAEDFANLF